MTAYDDAVTALNNKLVTGPSGSITPAVLRGLIYALTDALNDQDAAQDVIIAGKAAATHTHPQSDVTGLVSALAGKLSTSGGTITGDISRAADPTSGDHLARKSYVDSVAGSGASVPTGSVITWLTATPPSGYLECDGSVINRTTYASLFAVIGTSFGVGDGSTTFGLPDFRGEFLRGFDNGAGNDPDAASRTDRGDGTTGDNVGTKQADATDVNGLSASTTATENAQSLQPNTGGAHDLSRGPSAVVTVSSTDNETRPRNVAVMYCIKF